jgi:outer membrane receptor for ferrienterochelin and colicin
MKRKLLTKAVCLALAIPCLPAVAFAQDATTAAPQPQDAADQDREAKDLDTVVVTGSRIPRAVQETAAPTFTITAEEIQKQGFRNVSDVLRAQPLSTGAVQDNQFAGFTPEATTISLLGLDPSFTLILMDGRPLADFPLLYNGQSNFTDLSSIPVAMIERIDILPGNQSSI